MNVIGVNDEDMRCVEHKQQVCMWYECCVEKGCR